MSSDIVTAIDAAVRKDHQEKRRGHIGASALGNPCPRQVWYGFRWAYQEKHLGRMLRLFDRGHKEEDRFNRWLRMAGVEVRDYAQRLLYSPSQADAGQMYLCVEWEAEAPAWYEDVSGSSYHIAIALQEGAPLKQWGFTDHDGHFSGSCDGKIRDAAGTLGLPEGWGLQEHKTHNEKSFNLLTKKGLLSSKPTRYVQMQLYMHYLGLKWGLYLAVNKNDDRMYAEVIYYREEIALPYVATAWKLIEAKQPPKRMTEDPSWFECKFCAFREICHYGEAPQKNCRSCVFSSPAADGEWHCGKFDAILPKDFMPKGCDAWEAIG